MNARHAISLSALLTAALVTGYIIAPPVRPAPRQDSDALAEVLPSVDVEDGTYAAMLDYLNRISHTNIVANWTALHQLEVEPTTILHINLHVRNVALREVLNIICSHYEEPHPTFDVYTWTGYFVDSGVVIFTMRHLQMFEASELVTRAYDVSRLMDNLEKLPIIELPDVDTPRRQWSKLNSGDRLALLLYNLIEPDTWSAGAQIDRFYGVLLVTQTPEIQEKVRKFLESLDAGTQTTN